MTESQKLELHAMRGQLESYARKRLTSNVDAAEDIVSTVIMQVLDKEPENLKAYALGAIRFACNAFRKRKVNSLKANDLITENCRGAVEFDEQLEVREFHAREKIALICGADERAKWHFNRALDCVTDYDDSKRLKLSRSKEYLRRKAESVFPGSVVPSLRSAAW